MLFLLNEENRCCNLTSQQEDAFADEIIYSSSDFLQDKPISGTWDIINTGKGLSKDVRRQFDITDGEELAFWLMIGTYSYIFRAAQSDKCRKILIDLWEKLLYKLPINKGTIVRRYLKDDRDDFKIGDIWTCPYSLTCTTNNWPLNRGESIYEIKLLPHNQTKARNVFEIYNHGEECDNPEYQVNFLSNTKFHIDDVISMDNGGKKIVMHELQK